MRLRGGFNPVLSIAAGHMPITRSRRRAWTLRLTLGFCVSMAVCAGAPAGAGACASLAGSQVLPRLSPHGICRGGIGGRSRRGRTETITLNRVATGLKRNLDDSGPGKKDTLFNGRGTGGNVSVGDSFNNSGDGFTGQEITTVQ